MRVTAAAASRVLISHVAWHEITRKIVNPVHLAVHELPEVLQMSLV